jgi:NADPH-dependent 2,4-dienoyl-CoA reductase/sulfur reductase-like enzyme/nitrite reductase/ring-hydroxylating ferredoxin subunit
VANEGKRPSGPDFAEGVPAADLPDGGMISGRVGEEAVLLARVGDEIFALSSKCTHYGGPLGKGVLSGETVRCPWHHACFSLRTGEALRAPAIDPIARWRTEVSDEQIFVREKLPTGAPAATKSKSKTTGGRFVIVGGGAAGFAAAERLRREGFDGELTILSADDDPPVDRPNLSKDFLAGKAPEDWVFVKPTTFYAEQRIDLHLRARVTRLDANKKEVAVADGRTFAFDKLLLATGAEPIRLPIAGADQSHVFTLRSIADCRAIIRKAAASKVAVVIGAGFIGLEVAASLVERGLKVHVVGPAARPLEHRLGSELGAFVQTEHEAHGVIFHFRRKLVSIDGTHVSLDDGTKLLADLVVMGVGVRPRTDLAHHEGLRMDHGVVVDGFMETSVPGIFAAGDIARFPYALAGRGAIRVEHWVVAEQQGQVAAINMLGGHQKYDHAPFFWSQHYDVPINYVGHAGKWDAIEVVGDLKARDALVKYRRGGLVVAVASIFRDQESLRAELDLETGQ